MDTPFFLIVDLCDYSGVRRRKVDKLCLFLNVVVLLGNIPEKLPHWI